MGYNTGLIVTLFFSTFFCNGLSQNLKTQIFKTSNNVLSVDPDVDWWKTAVIYQVYVKSFKDSNNDGIGDLQGVIQKLYYLQDLGIDAIWLSPIFKSPQVDNGYDVSDYRDIDPIFGTLEDLRQLIDEAHKLNIKVLLDFVPNHTSDQHKWFQASLEGNSIYDEYYIWKNATYVDGKRKPPNNWISHFSDSAWEWNEGRQQYYFHQFSIAQPDLNYRNPAVVEEMKAVLSYWLSFGSDGFRMGAVGALFEDNLFRDEPQSGNAGVSPNDYDFLQHTYTIDQPESFAMIYEWRKLLDEFNKQNNTYTRIMITEGNADPDTVALFYGSQKDSRLGAHFSFNFITFLSQLPKDFRNKDLAYGIHYWIEAINTTGYTRNWLLGNHDNSRVSTRLGVENVDALNMLISILPGAQIIYQGEEIGQENGNVSCEEGTDSQAMKNCSSFDTTSRDFERTPFQWDNSTNAGFNDGAKTWLPVSNKYVETNLANQNVVGINSHYNIFKQMLTIRQEFKKSSNFDTTMWGWIIGQTFFYAQRTTENADYGFYFNIEDTEQKLDFPVFTTNCTVVVRNTYSNYKPGDQFNNSQPLKPWEAVLLKLT